MSSPLDNPWVQRSYRAQYRSLLDELGIRAGQRVLDVGSGMGFLKPLVRDRGAEYTGIEADPAAYAMACKLYGPEGFVTGYFPQAMDAGSFDVILALSCVDEVPAKAEFLRGVAERLERGSGVAYIAVRNRRFFVNRFKNEKTMASRSARARVSLTDLGPEEWESLFGDSGLSIVEKGKFWRPWLTGFSAIGVRNVLYRLYSACMPREHSYMLAYKLKTT